LRVPAILEHPQIRDRGMIATFDAVPGAGRDIQVVRTGVKINGAPPAVDSPPPRLGEHNHEIYRELGLSDEEIGRLEADSVV